jgi:hypothetical protein
MSQPDPQNPYQSPQAPPGSAGFTTVLPAGKLEKLEYLRAYQYIFDNPDWMMVLLWGALLMIIPVVGPLVLLGYMFVIIDALLESKGTRYPVLDLNRFVDYLVRGLWPFLAAIVLSLVLIPIYLLAWVVIVVAMLIARELGGDEAAGIVMSLMMLVVFSIMFVLIIGLNLVTLPMTLLALLFLMVSSFAVIMVGYLACCIGVLFAQPIVMLAYAHILYQLYAIYITRGGQPVTAKPAIKI